MLESLFFISKLVTHKCLGNPVVNYLVPQSYVSTVVSKNYTPFFMFDIPASKRFLLI